MISFASLSSEPLVFEPISSVSSVYYDPANGQVMICDKGEVLSIKFDPSCTVLSLQRKRNCVDFINFENSRPEDNEYSQTCRILPDSHFVRALKHGIVQTNWYAWDPLNKILLLSTGDLGNRFHVTSFANGSVTKCSSFEVPEAEILSPSSASPSTVSDDLKKLQQKNCLLANLYGQLYACILSRSLEGGVQLVLYQLMRRGSVRRRHILVVPEVGRIAVSFVRNLVLVHHQHSRTSLAYDIASADDEEFDDCIGPRYHYPLLPPVSLAEVSIPCKNVPALSLEPGTEFNTPLCILYIVPLKVDLIDGNSSSWIIIPPNVVIDGSLGCLWTVDLNLEAFPKLIPDPVRSSLPIYTYYEKREDCRICAALFFEAMRAGYDIALVDCLLNRPGAKPILRHYCQEMAEKLINTFLKSSSEGDGENSFVQQLGIVSHLLSRLAAVQKAAKKASKNSRSNYLPECGEERNQVGDFLSLTN
ncbi:unnamed protein product [Hydatigera taeniaeformis]|uniref:Mic1 domain-containing protein n=1 Tax=Hydatigena taeniaeformis TaxID=6205 RepID=A0A0R3X9L9_HYDTA|nr:unnamed protein product [Hydatigera taeniaeformis]